MDSSKRIEALSPKRLALLAYELEAKVRDLETARTEPVAIVGIACRIPGGCETPSGYWDLLELRPRRDHGSPAGPLGHRASISIPDPDAPGCMSSRWGGFTRAVDRFDAPFFGISRREAVSMDPQQRMLLEVCWEALENAGQSPHELHGSPTGVYVGLSHRRLLPDAALARAQCHRSIPRHRRRPTASPRDALRTCSGCKVRTFRSTRLAPRRWFRFTWPFKACGIGECRTALAGGVNAILSPDISIALSKSHMFAPDGRCKAFDHRADGFVRSEGCGIVVLKRLSDAVADGDNILALIRGSAVNQDGRSGGITAPNGAAQTAVIRQALANARVTPADIDYVEAHGTGTSLGDPIEAHALAAALGPGRESSPPLLLGSVKTNIGHLESAAGIAGLIKVVLSLKNERIPPHLHFERLNPHIDWKGVRVEIPTGGREWKRGSKPRLAGISSFGFSGTNAHVILEEAPLSAPAPAPRERGVYVLGLTARTGSALNELAGRYREHLEKDGAQLADICYTATAGRAGLSERAVYVGASREDLIAGLREGAAKRGAAAGSAPEVAFLFTGQGAQYAGMGRELVRERTGVPAGGGTMCGRSGG